MSVLDIATRGSAGHEIRTLNAFVIEPFKIKIISTGVHLNLPDNYYAHILPKSGLALKGIHVMGGVCDPDYKGEYMVILNNLGKDSVYFVPQQSIAQIVLIPFIHLDNANHLSIKTHEGFGSTNQ